MHCYETLNCDNFLNLSLAIIMTVIDELISSNDEEVHEQYKEKVKMKFIIIFFSRKFKLKVLLN